MIFKAFSLSSLFLVASDIPDAVDVPNAIDTIESVRSILLWSFSGGEYPVGLSMFKFLFIYSLLLAVYGWVKEPSRQILHLTVASFYINQLILPAL